MNRVCAYCGGDIIDLRTAVDVKVGDQMKPIHKMCKEDSETPSDDEELEEEFDGLPEDEEE
jgi:hypothetical protein